MPAQPLPSVPAGSDIFIDTNILMYGLTGQSAQCTAFLDRCSRGEITGITLFLVVNEATHTLMLGEAFSKGLIRKRSSRGLRQNHHVIPQLADYWADTQRILSLNVLFVESDEPMLRSAQQERHAAHLLTNDSIIVSCMRQYGVGLLATADIDFDRVTGITIFRPDDLS